MKNWGMLLIGLVFVTSFAMAQAPSWMYEGFEADWSAGTPAGWTKTNVVGSVDWDQKKGVLTGAGVPKASAPQQRAAVAWFPSSSAPTGTTTRLESPELNFTDSAQVRLRFFYVNVSNNTFQVVVSTDGGAHWVVVTKMAKTVSDGTWTQGYVVLDSFVGSTSNVKIGFEAVADSGISDIWLDRVVVQYPVVRIPDLQQVPAESLMAADAIPGFSNNVTQPRWTLQASPYLGDTVIVPALVVIPPKVITFTAVGWTMLLYDTAQANQWSGILLRANPSDTIQLTANGFFNVAPGDVAMFVGLVAEFGGFSGAQRGYSLTQLQPIPGHTIEIFGSASLPKHIVKNTAGFYTGIFSTGKVQYLTGEPFESMLVEFHNLTVVSKVNQSRGTFSAVDDLGNEISDYDMSRYFTLKGTSTDHPGIDTLWQKIYAGLGAGVRIDTLRGIITTSTGTEGPRGYRIAPIYYGDVVVGYIPPLLTSHRRYPVVVSPDSTPVITVKATRQTGGSAIQDVSLYYSVDGSDYTPVTMNFQTADTSFTHSASLPMQSANSTVRYFITVTDSLSHKVVLASSAVGANATDTSKGVFFYTVLNRPLTIRDVQYTPYVNGRTPYLGAVVSLSGIVTADTAHIALYAPDATAWYLQSTNMPWSGIWLATSDSAGQAQLAATRNGDSITVTGTVQEEFEVTRLGNISAVVKHSSGNPEPSPLVLSTGSFNVGNGNPGAEPYEGMLVRFNNVVVIDTIPQYYEYTVNDGSGAVVVLQGGINNFSVISTETGKTILKPKDRISSLTGVVYYSFNQYKIVPRTDADFGTVTDVPKNEPETRPTVYSLAQNYPNPFNPTTNIQYALPASAHVTLRIYNLLGQEVQTLVDQVQEPGRYTASFDARSLATGIYFYRIQAGQFTQVRKMMLVK
jgi:hypothetical protein